LPGCETNELSKNLPMTTMQPWRSLRKHVNFLFYFITILNKENLKNHKNLFGLTSEEVYAEA